MEQKENKEGLIELLRSEPYTQKEELERAVLFEDYLNKKAWERRIPLSGQFELTPQCNLDCKMCYVHLNKEQMKGKQELSTETWIDFIDQAIDAGMMHATLTGGECLIHPGFREIYLHLIKSGIAPSVLTNGLAVTEEMVEFFVKYQPKLIQITLYGSSDEVYERVTGVRAFSKVAKVIDLLMEAKLPLRLIITPNKYMVDDAKNMIRYAKGHALDYKINAELFKARPDTERELEEYNLSLEDTVGIFKYHAMIEGRTLTPVPFEELPEDNYTLIRKGKLKQPKETKGLLCTAGRNAFQITWKGEMNFCTNLSNVGINLNKVSFIDGWENLYQIVKEFPIPSECAGCVYYRICMKCPALHLKDAAKGHCSPAQCNRTKQMVAAGNLQLL